MIRRVLLSGAALLWMGGASVMADDCTGCQKMAQTGMGYCDECGHGKAFGVDVNSKKLYDALAGTEVKKLEDLKCKGCQNAVRTNGTCVRCKMSAARRTLYKSTVAHAMALGRFMPAEKAPKCSKTNEAHKAGWCDSCNIGFLSGQLYKTKDSYEAAQKANEILVRAVKTAEQCEDCAVAMVLDGKCDKCKVAYKNGEKQSG